MPSERSLPASLPPRRHKAWVTCPALPVRAVPPALCLSLAVPSSLSSLSSRGPGPWEHLTVRSSWDTKDLVGRPLQLWESQPLRSRPCVDCCHFSLNPRARMRLCEEAGEELGHSRRRGRLPRTCLHTETFPKCLTQMKTWWRSN